MAGILKFGTKVGILGGAIHYSRKIGVWKDSDTTYELGKTCVAYLSFYISKLENEVPIPLEIKNLPSREDACRTVSNYWNKGVISTVAFVECLPSTVTFYASKGVDYISEVIQQEKNKTISDS